MHKSIVEIIDYRSILLDETQKSKILDEGLHPAWANTLANHGVRMIHMMEGIGASAAEVIETKYFDFALDLKGNIASKGVFLATYPEFAKNAEKIFQSKISFLNKLSFNGRFYRTIFSLKTDDGFTFEMNADILRVINKCDIEKYMEYGFLKIPFIVKSGRSINVYYLKLTLVNVFEIENVNEEIMPLVDIPPVKKDSFLGQIVNGNYLRPWTSYDMPTESEHRVIIEQLEKGKARHTTDCL